MVLLRAAGCLLRVACCGLRVRKSYKFQVAGFFLSQYPVFSKLVISDPLETDH